MKKETSVIEIRLFKIVAVFLAVFAILILSGCQSKGADSDKMQDNNTDSELVVDSYRQISMDEALALMEEESEYIILDVRTVVEYSEGHIPSAINIPVESIGSEDLIELPDKNQMIMVYCRSGNRSKQASEKLVSLGYTNIVEFGGIKDWPGKISR